MSNEVAKMTASGLSLPARLARSKAKLEPASPEWIGGRAVTLLGHYFRPDDPFELSQAIGRDWALVLGEYPDWAIEQACIRWLKSNPGRKPNPGHIAELCDTIAWSERRELERVRAEMQPRQDAPQLEDKRRMGGNSVPDGVEGILKQFTDRKRVGGKS